jgi:hypothetical protein
MLNRYLLAPLAALLLLLAAPRLAQAQTGGVGIGTTAPDASAALDIVASAKGLLLPRLTAAQVAAIARPATGLLVFQTDGLAGFYYNAGTSAAPSWQQLTTATGTALTFGNGLTQTGSAVGLGGTLGRNTTLGLAGYTLGLTGGNVGIGTSSPAGLLDVVGQVTSPQRFDVDQQNTFANSAFTNLSSYWQSFTAGISGPLDRVVVYDNTFESAAGSPQLPGGALMTIYQGTGTSSSVLATQSFMVPATGTAGTAVTFSTPATLVAGQVYTFRVDLVAPPSATTRMSTSLCNNDCYANGSSSLPGTYDVKFQTGQLVAGSTSPASVLTVISSGVGIGTVAPTQKLEVAGNVKISGAGNGLTFPDGTTQTSASNSSNLIGDVTSNGSTTTYNSVVPATKGGAGYVMGLLKANGNGAVSQAVADNDYLTPATANTNFIQNGTAQQAGSFNVSGAGTVGGTLTAREAAVAGNITAGGTLTAGAAAIAGNITAGGTLTAGAAAVAGNITAGGTAAVTGNTTIGGSVGIGTTGPDASAALEVRSTSKGLLPPRMTRAQRDAIASPATGLTIYTTTTNKLNTWNGTSWDASLSTTEQPYQNAAVTFNYAGGPQTYTVPAGVTRLAIDARGASGGSGRTGYFATNVGGAGARVQTMLPVTPGQQLLVLVGGMGGYGQIPGVYGGYNGGGDSGYAGGAGGGASDVRSTGGALTDRLVVAAGGGGGGSSDRGTQGGAGGAPNGGDGTITAPHGSPNQYGVGGGATQTAGGINYYTSSNNTAASNGSLGQGGRAAAVGPAGGGGGGGYYGGAGGAGYSDSPAGGGGSSWVAPTASATTMTAGANVGDGVVTITPAPVYAAPALDASNFVNVPGDNLGNHTATQQVVLAGTGLRFADGTSQTTASAGDNLGNHTATQNLNLGANQLVGNGGTTGLTIASTGAVATAGALSTGGALTVAGALKANGLAGTGSRPVTVAADGTLAAGTNPQLSISNSTISLTNGGSVTLPDASATNELQTLSISGSTLSISGVTGTGSSIAVPGDNLGNHTATQQVVLAGTGLRFADGTSQTTASVGDNLGNHTATQQVVLAGTGLRFADGTSQTTASAGDNLGNHTATQNLNLGANQLVGNGGTTGLTIASTGAVATAGALSTGGALTVAGALKANGLAGTGSRPVTVAADGTLAAGTNPQLSISNSTISLTNGGSVTVPSSADNLGNHTATTNVGLNGNWLSNAPGNANGLRVDNSGNVGVGVGVPTQKLDVDGGILARSNSAISNQGAYLQWNRSGSEGETWLLNQQGGGGGGIRFGSATTANVATEWARFDGNGNLGLGTGGANPTQKLDVRGNVRLGNDGGSSATGPGQAIEWVGPGVTSDPVGIYRVNPAADQSELRVVVGDGSDANDKFVVGRMPGTSNEGGIPTGTFTPNFTVRSDGTVGIGTSTPTSTLQVAGSVAASIRALSSGTIADTDYTVLVIGNVSLPAPSAANSGRLYHIINGNVNTYVVTGTFRDGGSGGTVGSVTLNSTAGNRGITVQSDGSQWWILTRE